MVVHPTLKFCVAINNNVFLRVCFKLENVHHIELAKMFIFLWKNPNDYFGQPNILIETSCQSNSTITF